MRGCVINTYHKIQTVFLRDPVTKFKTLLMGEYALPEFKYLKDLQWDFTEKVNGTNIRVMFDGRVLSFAGKTDKAMMYPGIQRALENIFMPKLAVFSDMFMCEPGEELQVCLYGEGYGAHIQKGGGNYRPDQGFVLFDIKINGVWLKRPDVEAVAKTLEVDIVPLIGQGTMPDMVQMVKCGFNSQWGKFPAEGIVARPVIGLNNRLNRRIIAKLKTSDFR